MRIYTSIVIDIVTGKVLDKVAYEYAGPIAKAISLGGGSSGSSKSSSKSGTKWNQNFLANLFNAFPAPIYENEGEGVWMETIPGQPSELPPNKKRDKKNAGFPETFDRQQLHVAIPKFKGLEDMDFDRLERGIYDKSVQQLTPQYENERSRLREELSQSGMLTSPNQYAAGGATDQLTQGYAGQLQKAATDAVVSRYGLQQEELARKMGWDINMVSMFDTIYQRYADIALRAGGFGQSSGSSGGGWNFNLGIGSSALGGAKPTSSVAS